MAIQMRRGLKSDFDPSKMLPGEWAVSIDSDTSDQIVWMCFSPGVVKRIGTYEDLKSIVESMKGVAGGIATLDENGKIPNEQSPETDKSLTVDGMAADSKVVGDKINGLKGDLIQLESNTNEAFDSGNLMLSFALEKGYINRTTGENNDNSAESNTRCADYIPTYGSTRFFFGNNNGRDYGIYILKYDSAKTYIGYTVYGYSVECFDVESNVAYFRFYVPVSISNEHLLSLYLYKKVGMLDDLYNIEKANHKAYVIESDTKLTTYFDDIAPSIDTWGGTNATFVNEQWEIAESGKIQTNIEVEADAVYVIGLSVNGAVTPANDIIPFKIEMGSAFTEIFSANDANWLVALTALESGTVQVSLGGTGWYGNISNITIKRVNKYADIALKINNLTFRMYADNVAIGFGHEKLAGGDKNTAVGSRAQQYITTGKYNTAVGAACQRRLTNGSFNVGVGFNTQLQLTTGMYNTAVGAIAQNLITSGCWNVAVGNEAQRSITSGCSNVAIGRRAQDGITSGKSNVAIGSHAGFQPFTTEDDIDQVLIGDHASKISKSRADKCIAIGARASAGDNAIAIGADTSALSNCISLCNTTHETVYIAGKKINFNSDGTVTWENV